MGQRNANKIIRNGISLMKVVVVNLLKKPRVTEQF